MPEAMETDIRQSQLLARPPPKGGQPIGMQWRSIGLREDVIFGSCTTEPNAETRDILFSTMVAQRLERAGINRDKPLAMLGLWRFEAQPLLSFLETAFHTDHGA